MGRKISNGNCKPCLIMRKVLIKCEKIFRNKHMPFFTIYFLLGEDKISYYSIGKKQITR